MWIIGRAADLVFFSYGWVPVFYLLLAFPAWNNTLISMVLLFSYVHRHYTFALVYGEVEEFNRKRIAYTLLPFGALLATGAFVVSGSFQILKAISVLWTMFHSVAQKVGIVRVYSRKAEYGESWLEKGLLYSWFFYLFFAIARKEQETLMNYSSGRTLLGLIESRMDAFMFISYAFLLIAAAFTLTYAWQEIRHRKIISWPKNYFVVSLLLLYTTLGHSLVYGYIVFAFSHALEYIAFVNIYIHSKYRRKPGHRSFLAVASKNLPLYSTGFAVSILILCAVARMLDTASFLVYIIGSSFLHFIYDGWIWKMRSSRVGSPLGIRYPVAGTEAGPPGAR